MGKRGTLGTIWLPDTSHVTNLMGSQPLKRLTARRSEPSIRTALRCGLETLGGLPTRPGCHFFEEVTVWNGG